MKSRNDQVSFFTIVCFSTLTSILTSCGGSKKNPADFLYFQNGPNSIMAQQKETIIQPNDLLSIQVYSKTLNQDQTTIFNIPPTVGGAQSGYQVSIAGNIEMPVIGTVLAAGLSKNQLQNLLKEKLTNYVKNPSVIVRFLQFNINVMGEVRSPGTKTFLTDKVTVIDALTASGDLTDNGRREDVTVIREQEGKKVFYAIDLRNRSVFESPVYFLQPNDIVYVKPNDFKLKQLSVDPEVQRKTGLFTAALGIVITLTTLVFTVFR